MGILNVTPDSFSDGGRFMDVDVAVARMDEMVREGAHIIDIGGASSRPRGSVYQGGAALVDADQERARILPVIERLARSHPDVLLSVDTFRSDVAQSALEAGAGMLNDITALRFDPDMARVAAEWDVPLCLMHSVGMPGDMPHARPDHDIVRTVSSELAAARDKARSAGVGTIILDPGFGFGKTVEDNLRLMAHIPSFTALGCPVLIGVSRKSSVGAALVPSGKTPPPPSERLFGSLGVTAVAVLGGACIVRTHDVRETVEFLRTLHVTASSHS